MLRAVVPTIYCHDPLSEIFDYGSCIQQPRVGYSRMHLRPTSQMAWSPWPTLAAFAEAMKSTGQDSDNENACCCACTRHGENSKKSSDGLCHDGHTMEHQDCDVISDKSAQPSTSEELSTNSHSPDKTADESTKTSTSDTQFPSQSSEKGKSHDEVYVPVQILSDLDSDSFQVSVDLNGFRPEQIKVTCLNNKLKIYAENLVHHYGMPFRRETHRSYQLPDDVDAESLTSTLSATGVLSVKAERKPQPDNGIHHVDNEASLSDVKESQSSEKSFAKATESDGGESVDRQGEETLGADEDNAPTEDSDEEEPCK